ncbi:acyl-CoA dehydrogenase family protein [soil metagenome]
MALTADQFADQRKQAEELLFSGPEKLGFAKALFFGHFTSSLIFPYPEIKADERARVEQMMVDVQKYVDNHLDAMAIDRNAEIPQHNVDGLGQVGVLGVTAPVEFGGKGLSQLANTKIMEIIGGHCSSTAVFVNAHHSIGIRSLLMFGTDAQKQRYLPDLVSGKKLAAFALTEAEAGSDAANVQTTAKLAPDGKTWILNGGKRYITNGGIAGVLTVMARTQMPGTNETKVTAFLVTPDMPGFKVLEARMPKCGIRGTATGKMAFENMPVPAENILGQLGKGLRLALTVLDFGRVTFGASCTGAAKVCLEETRKYALERVQFKQKLADFELVKKKIAYMAAHVFAMEATTTQCAAFIDRDIADYMLETALLKVWSTEVLWIMVNDMLQVYGGKGYFSDQPYERMMRDARINQIGEGANDVLRSFITVVGIKPVADKLLNVKNALANPIKDFGKLFDFGRKQIGDMFSAPEIPVQHQSLKGPAASLGKRLHEFGRTVQSLLIKYREAFIERQYHHERVSEAACEIYASSCVLSRLDHLLAHGNGQPRETERDIAAGRYYLKISDRRIRQAMAALNDNDDADTTALADLYLK